MKIFLKDEENAFLRNVMGFSSKYIDGMDRLNLETTENLLEAIYLFSPKVLEHNFRVARKCMEVAAELGINTDKVNKIGLGAILHDIGIIGISKDLFTKEAQWNEKDLSEYYRHALLGKEIIEPISFLKKIIPFIESHHEYLNGCGYPKALKEQEIPFEVRILTVVNDFDMMSELFPWGKKYSFQENIRNIRVNSSIIYDGKVVEAFISKGTSKSVRRK